MSEGKSIKSLATSRMGIKAVWLIASCITAAALVLAYNFYRESKEDIIYQFNTEQLMLAREASMKMEEFHASLKRTLRLATDLVIQSGSKAANPPYPLNLEGLYKPYRDTPLLNIMAIGPDGNVLDYFGEPPDAGGTAIKEVYGKLGSIPPDEIYTSPLLNIALSGREEQKGFFMVSRVGTGQAPTPGKKHLPSGGAVLFSISLDRILDKYIKPVKSGRSGHAWVIDDQGTLLFQPKHPEMVFRNIFSRDESCNRCHSDFNIEMKMASGRSGMGRIKVAGYEDNLIAYHPVQLGEMKWSIAVTAPYSEVSMAINRLMKRNVLLGAVIVSMFLVSATLTTRYVRAAVKAEEEARYLKQEMALKGMLQKTDTEVIRLAAAIESMDTFVVLTDLEGTIFYINPSTEKGLGYSMQELTATGMERLCRPPASSRDFKYLLAKTAQGGWEGESILFKKDGTETPVHLITSLVKDRAGRPISITWSMRDLTETKELQYKLIQHEKIRALWVLAAGVAHDFNNILAAILANTQILLHDLKSKKLDPSRFEQKLNVIQNSTRRGAETVRRVQLYTRKGESSGMVDVNLNDVINQAIFTTQPQWMGEAEQGAMPIVIETVLKPVPPIKGVYLELLEAVINLIVNAVEAMPLGGKIVINSQHIGEYVQVSISDTGEGMSGEVREQVFDPFFTTKGPGSSGLGMSTALGIIQHHNGKIDITTKEGAGTTFNILLPVLKDTDGSKTEKNKGNPYGNVRILVIEDEVNTCNIICSLLSLKGYAVCCKKDVQSGLDKFRRKHFDLVVTELVVSDQQAVNVPTLIKELSPKTPVVALSQWHIGKRDEVDFKKIGVNFILTKPIESDELFSTVERAMQEM